MSDWGTCATCDAEAGIDRHALRQSAPGLTAEQAANWDRYMAAVRAGALRRTGLNDPNREFNLARLRAEMEAQGVRRG